MVLDEQEMQSSQKEQYDEPDFDCELTISVLKQICDEYKISAMRLQRILEKILTPDDISGNVKHVLKETAASLQALSVHDANSTNVMLQQSMMMLEESEYSRKKLKFQNNITKLNKRRTDLQQRGAELQREMQSAKEEHGVLIGRTERKAAESQLFKHKINEYNTTTEKLKGELQRIGVSNLEVHKQIKERMEATEIMRNELDALRLKLDHYEGLPPDITEAEEMSKQTKLKCEQADQELKLKQKTMSSKVLSISKK